MLDPRSLFLLGAVVALVTAALVYSSRRLDRRPERGLVWMAGALSILGMAIALVGMRGVLPDALTFVVANSVGLFGIALLHEATRRLMGQPSALRVLMSLSLGGTLFYVLLGTSEGTQFANVVATSSMHLVLILLNVPVLIRGALPSQRVAVSWAIAWFLIYGLAHAMRLVHALTTGTPLPNTMETGVPALALLATIYAVSPMIFGMAALSIAGNRLANDYKRLAQTDALTGLPTRRAFQSAVRAALQRMHAPGSADGVAAIMVLDIDHFKRINDHHGHDAGDRVLSTFATVLRASAPAGAVLGRHGGEEFCLFAPIASREAALQAAESICEAVRSTAYATPDATLKVTVSIGVACTPWDGRSLDALMLAADRNVYLAKRHGRDRAIAQDTSDGGLNDSPVRTTVRSAPATRTHPVPVPRATIGA